MQGESRQTSKFNDKNKPPASLVSQLEASRQVIHTIQKDYKKIREMYRIDYEKVQLLLSKKKDIIKER